MCVDKIPRLGPAPVIETPPNRGVSERRRERTREGEREGGREMKLGACETEYPLRLDLCRS